MTNCQDRNYQSPQPVTPVRPSLTILADDLTGACDAAVPFTAVCDSVCVQINSEPWNGGWIKATTTESRDLPVSEAEARIRTIAARLPHDAELFKKIDSVFRGNTVAEITATLRYAHFDIAIIAPAYPVLGRTVRRGILYIHDASAHQTLPLIELLTGAGCSLTTLPADMPADEAAAALRRCLSKPKPAILCDAVSQDDLTRVVTAARSLGTRILWIGSGGLAHALAAELPLLKSQSVIHPRTGHTIFFIGSPHPVTGTQVEHLRSHATHSSSKALVCPVVLGETTADDIRRAVAAYDPAEIGCLFMTGGDTAHFICRGLGIHALRLEREFAPGVPLAIAEGGPFHGVSVVLKSGGFGEPDLLCRLLETCRPEVIA
jgi:uncharacterized protein YgbK (DUF1537 family)